MNKRWRYGIRGCTHQLKRSYLKDRKQIVTWKKKKTSLEKPKSRRTLRINFGANTLIYLQKTRHYLLLANAYKN